MAIARREFETYESYVYKQGGKARGRPALLLEQLPNDTKSFCKTFLAAAPYLKPGAVLCLGARTGAESIGAVQAGFVGSVGIDLHPVGPTVLRGDWHCLEFADASFANAYSNSLDHCLHLDRFAAEVRRVLKPGGRLYVMATNRADATVDSWRSRFRKSNEAMFWDSSDDLRDALCGYGFTVTRQWHTGKWGHYVLAVKA